MPSHARVRCISGAHVYTACCMSMRLPCDNHHQKQNLTEASPHRSDTSRKEMRTGPSAGYTGNAYGAQWTCVGHACADVLGQRAACAPACPTSAPPRGPVSSCAGPLAAGPAPPALADSRTSTLETTVRRRVSSLLRNAWPQQGTGPVPTCGSRLILHPPCYQA